MTDTPAATRHLSLDALRGIAVMGILVMNIVAFGMPFQAYINPLAWGGATGIDLAAWATNFVLVDGKMRGFFSLLFGASTLLVIDGAAAAGGSAGRTHYARMGWLALFGLAHYYLIWSGDILFLYAIMGMIVFLFRGHDARGLLKWALIFLCANFVVWGSMAGMLHAFAAMATAPGADAEMVAGYREMIAGMGAPGSEMITKELLVYRGGYDGILAFRTHEGGLMPFMGLIMNGLETMGFMLLGMALFRNGFLLGQWDRAAYRRIAIRCYLIGLPAMMLLAWWIWASGFDPVTSFATFFAWAAPFRPVLIVAHAALALMLIVRFADSALVRRIAATGRAAFTNYLGTSLIMTTIFYGYGFGLFGTVGRAGLWPFVLLGWAVMLAWSLPWLKRFRYGPLEWLWRSLARGSVQPMRLAPA